MTCTKNKQETPTKVVTDVVPVTNSPMAELDNNEVEMDTRNSNPVVCEKEINCSTFFFGI